MKKDLKIHITGFTLIEVMIVIAIVSILASIATPNYIKYRDKAQIAMAITEMGLIEKQIVIYLIDHRELPENLSEIGMDKELDPWGRPYHYLRIGDKGKPRKDHQLHPINSDYDLFSVGKDGKSNAPLTSEISQDDIIRANSGGYVGLVSNY